MTEDIQKTETPKRSLLMRLRGYLIAGVLVTAPITITIWLTVTLINIIDNQVTNLLPPQYDPELYLPFSVPGLGLIAVLLFLIVIGFLATNFMGRFFVRIGEEVLDRLPIIRSLYGAIKQILETVLADQADAFREVVMIEYPRKNSWVIGFLTGRSKGEVQQKTASDTVNIFVPTTPNPTSGFLLFVPEKDVIRLDMTVEEGIKLVVSAGIVSPEQMKKMQKKKPRNNKKSS
jgi:uncharacterized membrane protein